MTHRFLLALLWLAMGGAQAAEQPGSLVDSADYRDIDPVIRDVAAESLKVHYRSSPNATVGAALFIPKGTPPKGEPPKGAPPK